MMVVTHRNCPFWQERKRDDARPLPGHCNSPKDCGVSMKGVRPGLNGVGGYVIVPAYTHIGRPIREDPKKKQLLKTQFGLAISNPAGAVQPHRPTYRCGNRSV